MVNLLISLDKAIKMTSAGPILGTLGSERTNLFIGLITNANEIFQDYVYTNNAILRYFSPPLDGFCSPFLYLAIAKLLLPLWAPLKYFWVLESIYRLGWEGLKQGIAFDNEMGSRHWISVKMLKSLVREYP